MRRDEDFEADLTSGVGPAQAGGHGGAERLAADDEEVMRVAPELSGDDLAQLTTLEPGTRLHQGATYVDLEDPERQPFTARAGQEAGTGSRLVAKRDTDHELWGRLT